MRVKRSEKTEEKEIELPKVEVFPPSEGKPSTGDLVASESRMEYRSPTYSEAPVVHIPGHIDDGRCHAEQNHYSAFQTKIIEGLNCRLNILAAFKPFQTEENLWCHLKLDFLTFSFLLCFAYLCINPSITNAVIAGTNFNPNVSIL